MADAIRIEISIEATDNTGKAIQSVEKGLQGLVKAASEIQSSMNKASDGVSKFDRQADKTSKTLQNWVKQKWQVALEAKDAVSPVLTTIKNGLSSLVSKVWSVTVKVMDFVTAPIRGIFNLLKNPVFQAGSILGITVGLKDTIDTYKDFEATMSKVEAISGATASELTVLTDKAKEMGATPKLTATEAAEAFSYMAMAGWRTEDMLSGIEGIPNLAAASGESLGTTADIVTDALTAFGLSASEAGHFSDVLAAASSNSNTNVAMMGETFKYVGAMAGTLGYSIEDVALAVGLMANAGIKSSQAGTELNNIFTRLSTNTDGARDAIQALGVTFFDETGTARSFTEVLTELRDVTKDMTMEQKTNFANTVAGTQAQAGLLAMLNASEADYRKLSGAISHADGAAERMSKTMLDNLQGSFTMLQSALDGVKLSLGERLAPYFRSFAEGLTEYMPEIQRGAEQFMDWFDEKVDAFRQRFEEAISAPGFKDMNLFDKAKHLWNSLIAEPFSKWWAESGKRMLSDMAADAGSFLGTGLKNGLMGLLGIDISDAASEGASIGHSFAEGFMSGFGTDTAGTVLKSVAGGMANSLAKLIPGGEAPGLDTAISALVVSQLAKPFVSAGKFLFGGNAALGGASLMGTIMGSASAGTGLLGLGANAAIALGAGNLAGGASLSAGALSAIGLGSILGGLVGGGTLISGGADIYRRSQSTDQAERDMYRDTAAAKFVGVGGGAALGAAIGAAFGGIGAIPGALIGAGIGGIAGLFAANDRKEKYEEEQRRNEEEAAAEQRRLEEAAAAQALLNSKAQVTGRSLGDLTFKSKELNDALRNNEVSVAQFGAMFQEAVNQKLVDSFGDITLSMQEIKDLASSIVFDGISADVDSFSFALESSASALASVKSDIASLEKSNWKASLGLQLSAEDVSSYQAQVDSFVNDSLRYIEDKHYEATVALRLIMGSDVDTSGLDLTYGNLTQQVEGLQQELQQTLSSALADGVITNETIEIDGQIIQINEMEAITNLQNQIRDIVNAVASAQSEAQLDVLNIKYGGAQLDYASFQQLQLELAENMKSVTATYDEALEVSITSLRLQLANGDINQEAFNTQLAELAKNYQLQIAQINARVESFQLETVADAFGAGLSQAIESVRPELEGTTSEKMSQIMHEALAENPNPAKWTTDQIVGWLGLDSIEDAVGTEAVAGIAEMFRSTAETIPQALIEMFQEQFADVDLSEATTGLSDSLGESISEEVQAALDQLKDKLDPMGLQEAFQETIAEGLSNINLSEAEGATEAISTALSDTVTAAVESVDLSESFSGVSEKVSEGMSQAFQNVDVSGSATGVKTGIEAEVTTTLSSVNFTAAAEALSTSLGSSIASAISSTDLSQAFAALAALRSQIEAQAQATMGAPMHVTIPVTVTYDYTVTNPNPPAPNTTPQSTTASAGGHALGGFIYGPELSWVGEDGPEAIIPLGSKRRSRGLELYEQVGEVLGVARNAEGGLYGLTTTAYEPQTAAAAVFSPEGRVYTGAAEINAARGDSGDFPLYIEPTSAAGSSGATGGAVGGTPVAISVNMSPQFKIEGGGEKSEAEIVAILQRHVKDMADEVGGEIAERLDRVFDNMPLRR